MLATLLKEERSRQKLSVLEVSIRARLDPSLVSRYEGGNRLPTREHVLRLAAALDLNTEELLVEWLCDKVQKVLKEEKDAGIVKRSLQQLNGEPVAKKTVRSSAVTNSQESALTRWKERVRVFQQQNPREWQQWRREVLFSLCCLFNTQWKEEHLRQVLLEGKTHSAYSLLDHLNMHQSYELLLRLEAENRPMETSDLENYLRQWWKKEQPLPSMGMKASGLLDFAELYVQSAAALTPGESRLFLLMLLKNMGFPLLPLPEKAPDPKEDILFVAETLGHWMISELKKMDDH